MRFAISASNGYRISMFADRDLARGSKALVSLTVERHHQWASYDVYGRVDSRGVHASFGRLGFVSLRFHPTGRVLRYRCLSGVQGEARTHVGVFSGRFRFDGEHGYTRAHARQIRGGEGSPLAPLNHRQSEAPCSLGDRPGHADRRRLSKFQVIFFGPGLRALYAGPRRNHHLSFSALPLHHQGPRAEAPKAGPTALFQATSSERRGRVTVTRQVLQAGGQASLRFLEGRRTISVSPPAPFSGSATFHQGREIPTTWLGSLSVPFPGRESQRLAGPEFKAAFESDGSPAPHRHSQVSARCETGRLQARGQLSFNDDTFLSGTLIQPCEVRDQAPGLPDVSGPGRRLAHPPRPNPSPR
jgi:hypothetical protein